MKKALAILVTEDGWVLQINIGLVAIILDQKSTVEAGFRATANNGIRYQAEYNSSALDIQLNQEVSISSNLL